MQPDSTIARIPLYAPDGSVWAYATVDAADADWLNQWRWSISPSQGSYAYRTERVNGRLVSLAMHRSILGLERGDPRQGDHISRNRLDNRRENLRILPRGANAQNQSAHRDSTSRYRGVSWNKKKSRWRASIHVDGKVISLGDFKDELQAAEAAREARLRHMPYAVD
jgi:hypothetical protein